MPVERMERESPDTERLEQLRELFPEVLTEGNVDLEHLRAVLEGSIADFGSDNEHYGLTWPGKASARKRAAMPPTGTLRPLSGEGVDEATTKNLLLVGDNLEILRMLQKSYASRVKLVYIDPPYNTGKDFIYNDNFRDPVEAYLEATRQSELGALLTSNPKSDGRFHSRWLSMMYPRLVLARRVLRDDGVIFVSIDDHEVHNLRMLMDEVFGPDNFITTVVWQKVFAVKNSAEHFSASHDFILVYAKNADLWDRNLLPRTTEQLTDYKNPDNDPRGLWNSVALSARNPYSEGLWGCTTPSGRPIAGPPKGRYWAVSYKKFVELDADHRIWWGKTGDGIPRRKVFLSEVQQGVVPETLWLHGDVGNTQEAKKQLLERVSFARSETVFDTPKPTRLIAKMLQLATAPEGEDLVMDFFAGSGTTGEAVLEANARDGGDRRFILVQMPEVTGHEDFATIADITKARLRAASKAIREENASGGTLELPPAKKQDFGFRVLLEDRSNLQRWVPYDGDDDLALVALMRGQNGLTAGWTPDALLVEVMLLEGYPFDSTRSQHPDFLDNVVTCVAHVSIPVRLLICLDDQIADATVEALAGFKDHLFVCRERALTDVTKVRIADVIHRVKTL